MDWIYPPSQWERTMKIQEVFSKAYHETITWKEAARIMGVDPRTVRRWKNTVEEDGFQALLDRRRRAPSPKRAPENVRYMVTKLYRRDYHEWNVKHFHEQLRKKGVKYSYTWTKSLLQSEGLVEKTESRDKHRKRRPRKPVPGMMLHIDGSDHEWIPDLKGQKFCLIPILDDATSEVYAAMLFREEGTKECMSVLRQVVCQKGVFCSIYSDRAGHFFETPKAGGKVDLANLTQIGRALYELGIQMIPAYSPQARGRCERFFGTWQDRLPKELKLRGIKTLEGANRYIQEIFIPWHNQNLTVKPMETGSAFGSFQGRDLNLVFSIKEQRTVNGDNTVQWQTKTLQLEPSCIRISFAKCRVSVCEHLDGALSVLYGPQVIGRFDSCGNPLIHMSSQRERKEAKERERLLLVA
jgi:transposase